MATTRYSTSVTLCEDTSSNYELYDLLRQADPNYVETAPARIKLYVLDPATNKYVEVTSGFFSSVDLDTLAVDMSLLPNFNGIQKVRVLGTDSSSNTFVLDLQINVTPVNDAPSGSDDTVAAIAGRMAGCTRDSSSRGRVIVDRSISRVTTGRERSRAARARIIARSGPRPAGPRRRSCPRKTSP